MTVELNREAGSGFVVFVRWPDGTVGQQGSFHTEQHEADQEIAKLRTQYPELGPKDIWWEDKRRVFAVESEAPVNLAVGASMTLRVVASDPTQVQIDGLVVTRLGDQPFTLTLERAS